MSTIFEGVRVLDLSEGMAGSLATMIMADNGAEVIKAERPGGDPFRSMPAWTMWNRGKRGIVLDLDSEAGHARLDDLAGRVDVLVESARSADAARLGLDPARLAEINPRLIHASIVAFAGDGDYADLPPYGPIVEAKGGVCLKFQTEVGRDEPSLRVRPNASWATVNTLLQAISAALIARERSGLGQHLEASMYGSVMAYDMFSSVRRQVDKGMLGPAAEPPGPPRAGGSVNFPYMVVRCKDGQWLQMANMAARLFPLWIEAMGLSHIYDDPRFAGAPFGWKDLGDQIHLHRMIVEAMLTKTADEWLDVFQEKGVAADKIISTQQAMDHPVVLHNGGVVEIDDPAVGATQQIGPLIKFGDTPSVIGAPAPLLGEHDAEPLPDLTALPAPVDGAPPSAPPLEGMTILDFSTWLAAPVGTTLLAGLGARVIKVEPPGGDEFRPMSNGLGFTFQGKESVVIDLKTEEGRAAVHKLVAKADALMHNMRGQAPERCGIDYETVRTINPSIIYHYAGSYGSTGPGAGRAAFHPIGGALSGGQWWQVGRGNEPPPNDVEMGVDEIIDQGERLRRANEGSPDVTSALAVGAALAMALYHRQRTGKGQYLETTMVMSNCYICSDDFIRYEGKPERRELDRALRGTHALSRLYRGKEGWVFLEAPTADDWERLRRALDLPADPRFDTPESRARFDDQLVAELSMVFAARGADEWEADLRAAGVACVRADTSDQEEFFLTDPVVEACGLRVHHEHHDGWSMWRQGPPVKLSRTPGRAEVAAPFGYDTASVLREVGYGDDDLRSLAERGIALWHQSSPDTPAG